MSEQETPTNANELYAVLREANDEFEYDDHWAEICEAGVDKFADHAPEAFAEWAKQIIEDEET